MYTGPYYGKKFKPVLAGDHNKMAKWRGKKAGDKSCLFVCLFIYLEREKISTQVYVKGREKGFVVLQVRLLMKIVMV